jgi:hypothetical protein
MIEDKLLLYKLISDSGLLILIWLVQLVIYPGFKYHSKDNLMKWHSVYTGRITIVVLPLMLSQLILSVWILLDYKWSVFSVINLSLVLLTWMSTFMVFVPLHHKIDEKSIHEKKRYVIKLINYNWFRTAIWSIIFILTLNKVL